MASDVTALTSIIHEAHYDGLNVLVLAVSAGTNTDFINLNKVLDEVDGRQLVKFVHYAHCIHTPYGTSVNIPIVLKTSKTTISDIITIGGSISGNKILRITVFYE